MEIDSILTSIKKLVGIPEDYTQFDTDIIMHINTAFTILNQLGVGPDDGFKISDKSTTWSDYLGTDMRLESVKTYVYLRVKQLFDPPQNATHMDAMNRQIDMLEFRLNVEAESGKEG